MQKSIKKWIAYGLALALILTSLVPMQSAQAASKPKLNAAKKTLAVGDRTSLKVSNKVKNAKYTWTTSDKSVARVSSKGSVKAAKKGTAVVSCKVKVNNKTKYTLKCKVTVSTGKTVTTQKALNAALKNKKLTAVTLKTNASSNFTIAKGDYTGKTFTADAPNADVENSGQFKSITIKNIKPNTWVEKADNNTIQVSAKTARIVVDEAASVNNVTFLKSDAKVALEVEGTVKEVKVAKMSEVSVTVNGTVGKVSVDAASANVDMNVEAKGTVSSVALNASATMNVKAEGKVEGVEINSFARVVIEGNSEKIPVTVTEAGEGATLTSSVPVEVAASSNVQVNLEKGAEGSKIEATTDKVEVAVKNESQSTVTVTTPSGTTDVETGKDTTTNIPDSDTSSDGNTGNGGTDNGGGDPTTPTKKVTKVTLNKSETSLEVGKEEILTAAVEGEGNISKTVTWTSSEASVADVDSTGKVTAKKAGEATITATSTEDAAKSASCKVTVTDASEPPIEPTEPVVALSTEDFTLEAGTSTASGSAIKVTVDGEAYIGEVAWTSDTESVATVKDGIVTAVSAGTAVIKAAIVINDKEYSAQCTVTVTAKEDPGTPDTPVSSEATFAVSTDDVISGFAVTIASGSALTAASCGSIQLSASGTAITISGELNKCTEIEGVSGSSEGYFIPIQIQPLEGVDTSKCSININSDNAQILSQENSLAVLVFISENDNSPTFGFEIDWDGAGTKYSSVSYTFNLSCTYK